MANRGEIIERWETLLAESRQSPPEDAPRMRWLRRMRERLYTFLLATYGSARWRPDAVDAQPAEPPSSASLIDLAHDRGAPPKSIGRIRKTLKALHAAERVAVEPGPLTRGLSKNDMVVAALFRHRLQAQVYLSSLKRHGIRFQTSLRGKDTIVSVSYGDRDLANKLWSRVPRLRRVRILFCPRWTLETSGEPRSTASLLQQVALSFLCWVPTVTGILLGILDSRFAVGISGRQYRNLRFCGGIVRIADHLAGPASLLGPTEAPPGNRDRERGRTRPALKCQATGS